MDLTYLCILWSGLQIEANWWSEDDPSYHYLARGPGDPGDSEWVEAAYLHKHAGLYYLFVNWYGCCAGVDSTYEIHVGRSQLIHGPYLDKDGRDMKLGGGEIILITSMSVNSDYDLLQVDPCY